jgi:hypothetical protein
MKARSLECRQQTPANDAEIHEKAADLWIKTRRKALVDVDEIYDNVVKQGVIKWCDAKYLKKGK